jgi:DNA-3-methyladenine glycosylase
MRASQKKDVFDIGRTVPLKRSFFARDAQTVSRELLGKVVVRRNRRKLLAGRIVETEAYLGREDPAAHAFSGKTPRNAVLFGPPGHAYVYFIYGNHYCLNFSCEPEGRAGCVLIRALEPLAGERDMAVARDVDLSLPRNRRLLTSGPGRLAEALGITRERDNGKDIVGDTDLFVVDDAYRPAQIIATPRIGIRKAADDLLRFVIAGNDFISGKRVRIATSPTITGDEEGRTRP